MDLRALGHMFCSSPNFGHWYELRIWKITEGVDYSEKEDIVVLYDLPIRNNTIRGLTKMPFPNWRRIISRLMGVSGGPLRCVCCRLCDLLVTRVRISFQILLQVDYNVRLDVAGGQSAFPNVINDILHLALDESKRQDNHSQYGKTWMIRLELESIIFTKDLV